MHALTTHQKADGRSAGDASPSHEMSRGEWWTGAGAHVAVAILTAAAIVGRLLMTGNPFDFMWAEDGKVFLAGGRHLGSFLHSYAGYGHFVPRLLAAAGSLLPVQLWAAYAVVAAAGAVGALAVFVRWAAVAVTGSALTGWVAAAALSLTPALKLESLGSLANLQWFMLAATVWACFLPSERGRAASAVVAGLTAATTPLALLLLPAAVLVHRRHVWRLPALWAVAVGLAYQAVVIRFGPVDPGGPVRSRGLPPHALSTTLDHIAGENVTGHFLAWVTVAAVVALLVLGCCYAGRLRWLIAASAGTAVCFLVTVTWISGEVASRYVGAASMVMAAAIAIAIGSCGRRCVPAVLVIALAAFVALPAAPIKFLGPGWRAGVASWRTTCARTGAPTGAIPVAPPGWGTATVTCPRSSP